MKASQFSDARKAFVLMRVADYLSITKHLVYLPLDDRRDAELAEVPTTYPRLCLARPQIKPLCHSR